MINKQPVTPPQTTTLANTQNIQFGIPSFLNFSKINNGRAATTGKNRNNVPSRNNKINNPIISPRIPIKYCYPIFFLILKKPYM